MIPGELVFLHHDAGAHIRVPPDSAIVTVEDPREDGRARTFVVHAKVEGATTFDVVSTSGVARHRVDVVRSTPGSLEEALVGFAARRASVRLFRRTREPASAAVVWIVDGCFTEDDVTILIQLEREHHGRVETTAGGTPKSGSCEK